MRNPRGDRARGRGRWLAALVAAVLTLGAAGAADAAPDASQPAEVQALEGFRMTALMLGLVAGVIPKAHAAADEVAALPALGLLEIERRVWAGEEGFAAPPLP